MASDASAIAIQPLPGDLLPRGNYFAEGTYLKTDIPRGVTRNRSGMRMCALSEDFLRGFRKAILDECGSAADTVLATCGRKWGELFARRFVKEMSEFYGQPLEQFTLATFLGCLTELFSHHGWGKLSLDLRHYDRGILIAELWHPVMGALVDHTEAPVEAMMAGILAGFFAHLTGEPLACVQTCCTACGADTSRFVIALQTRLEPVRAWVQEGRPHEEIVAGLLVQSRGER